MDDVESERSFSRKKRKLTTRQGVVIGVATVAGLGLVTKLFSFLRRDSKQPKNLSQAELETLEAVLSGDAAKSPLPPPKFANLEPDSDEDEPVDHYNNKDAAVYAPTTDSATEDPVDAAKTQHETPHNSQHPSDESHENGDVAELIPGEVEAKPSIEDAVNNMHHLSEEEDAHPMVHSEEAHTTVPVHSEEARTIDSAEAHTTVPADNVEARSSVPVHSEEAHSKHGEDSEKDGEKLHATEDVEKLKHGSDDAEVEDVEEVASDHEEGSNKQANGGSREHGKVGSVDEVKQQDDAEKVAEENNVGSLQVEPEIIKETTGKVSKEEEANHKRTSEDSVEAHNM